MCLYSIVKTKILGPQSIGSGAGKKPLWQVGTVPDKIGDAVGSIFRYATDSFNVFFCPT